MQTKVCIPVEIIRNQHISPRARIVWAELFLLPRGNLGEIVVNQKEFAAHLGVCVSTLKRALQILLLHDLIRFAGLHEKKYKRYLFTPSITLPTPQPDPIPEPAPIPEPVQTIEPAPIPEPTPEIVCDSDAALTPAEKARKKEILDYVWFGEHFLKLYKEILQKQFPLLGKEGRPEITPELIAEMEYDRDREGSEELLLVFATRKLKVLSGEKIKPIPPMSQAEYLNAIIKQEDKIYDSLGEERGRKMLLALANDWGYQKYDQQRMEPKTRPGIARAIGAV